jgi:succinoglycan biosynthesis protein ExoV
MKLYYWSKQRNFGDDLNPWLWSRLIPEFLDTDDRVLFVGCGTLLNHHLPRAERLIVFGTGVGYVRGEVPKVNKAWTIYCLRGPLSAEALGVSQRLAVTDSAMLVRGLVKINGRKVRRFSYMPHAVFANERWKTLCNDMGFGYVDATAPIEQVIAAIQETEVLLTEAMHGAIVADALRVPWIPIRTSPIIFPFKWQDWCLSVGVPYDPKHLSSYLMPLWSYRNHSGIVTAVRGKLKMGLITRELRHIAERTPPTLSRSAKLEQVTSELRERLEQLRGDIRQQLFDGEQVART